MAVTLLSIAGCSVKKPMTYTAGTILINPDDGLTSVERNNQRSLIIANQMWNDYYDEELNASFTYFPYKDDSEEIASCWHFTSILSLYVKLVRNNPNDKLLKERLKTVLDGLEYYHEKRNDGYASYSVG